VLVKALRSFLEVRHYFPLIWSHLLVQSLLKALTSIVTLCLYLYNVIHEIAVNNFCSLSTVVFRASIKAHKFWRLYKF